MKVNVSITDCLPIKKGKGGESTLRIKIEDDSIHFYGGNFPLVGNYPYCPVESWVALKDIVDRMIIRAEQMASK